MNRVTALQMHCHEITLMGGKNSPSNHIYKDVIGRSGEVLQSQKGNVVMRLR